MVGGREGGLNRRRSLRLALSWFSGTYRSSERGEPCDGRKVGGRERGRNGERERENRLTQPSKPPSRRTIQSKHAWFPPCRWFPSPSLAVSSPPTRRSPLEEGGRGRRKPVEPPLCTSGYILDKEPSRSSTEGRRRVSLANKGTALFCSFQLNPHRYTRRQSVSVIRARVQEEPLFPIKINPSLRVTVYTIAIQNSRLASNAICMLICERIALTLAPAFRNNVFELIVTQRTAHKRRTLSNLSQI